MTQPRESSSRSDATATAGRARVTFVVPGIETRSGGLRVTVWMANLLLDRGHVVRIAYPFPRRSAAGALKATAARAVRAVVGKQEAGWTHLFRGKVEGYADVADLETARGEVVLAVGTQTIRDVAAIPGDVIRVRSNHGFPAVIGDEVRSLYAIPMTTITVSSTLVPTIESLSGQRVLAVVPNGIDETEYHLESGVRRDAVGTIFHNDPTKAPQDILDIFRRLGAEVPSVPRVAFSTMRRPRDFDVGLYERLPSVARCRAIYNGCLVWVLASRHEGFPAPVLEAMACGAAVVSAENFGARELIQDGVNGRLVPKGDIDALVVAIRELLGDDALRARLVAGGLETVKRISWPAAADRMEEFLRRVTVDPPQSVPR